MGSSCVPAKTRAEQESSCRTRRASQPRRKHCELRADQLGVTGILPGAECLSAALVWLLAIVVSCDKESVGTPCWLCLWHAPSPASRPYLPCGNVEMRKSRLFACPNVSGHSIGRSHVGNVLSRTGVVPCLLLLWLQASGDYYTCLFSLKSAAERAKFLVALGWWSPQFLNINRTNGFTDRYSYCRYNLLKSWKQSLIFFIFCKEERTM